MFLIIVMNFFMISGLTLKFRYYENSNINIYKTYDINLCIASKRLKTSKLIKKIKYLKKTSKEFYFKEDLYKYERYFNNENKSKKFDKFSYSVNSEKIHNVFHKKSFDKPKNNKNLPPLIILFVDDILIDHENVILLHFIFFVARCLKNVNRKKKEIRVQAHKSIEKMLSKDYSFENKHIGDMEKNFRFYNYLVNVKNKNGSLIQICMEIISKYLSDAKEPDDFIENFNKNSIFSCDKKVCKILKEKYCKDLFYSVLSEDKQILLDYLK